MRSWIVVADEGAHPRSRGENTNDAPHAVPVEGSSPLTRGKHQRRPTRRTCRGLIPTHAGKTPPSGPCRARARAHPRSRGENGVTSFCQVGSVGSSPLTRGKRGDSGARPRLAGLIHAHAGKTRRSRRRAGRTAAHPHSRGENPPLALREPLEPGSSPLTRGKHRTSCEVTCMQGIIPAHAGKTVLTRSDSSPGQGSSPLTRGKPIRILSICGDLGLIPARAGKTPGIRARWHAPCGSSPLARGKPFDLRYPPATPRLIPARAGKTFVPIRR